MAVIYDRVCCITHISFCQTGVRTFWKLSLLIDCLLLGQQGFSARTPSTSFGSEHRWPFRFTTLLLPCKSGFATALGVSSVSVHRINSLSADILTFNCTCSMNTYMYLRTWLTCLTGWFQPNFSGLSVTVLSLTRKALWYQQPASPALRVNRVVLWAGRFHFGSGYATLQWTHCNCRLSLAGFRPRTHVLMSFCSRNTQAEESWKKGFWKPSRMPRALVCCRGHKGTGLHEHHSTGKNVNGKLNGTCVYMYMYDNVFVMA